MSWNYSYKSTNIIYSFVDEILSHTNLWQNQGLQSRSLSYLSLKFSISPAYPLPPSFYFVLFLKIFTHFKNYIYKYILLCILKCLEIKSYEQCLFYFLSEFIHINLLILKSWKHMYNLAKLTKHPPQKK